MGLVINEVILGKSETNYNRDPGLSPSADAILVEALSWAIADAKMIERNPVGPAIGGAKAAYSGTHLKSISFKIRIKGSGTATTPPELAVILKAAGFVETVGATDVSYATSSAAANFKSATFYYYEDGLLHKLTGAYVEKLDGTLEVGGAGVLDVTITGHTCEWGTATAGGSDTITLQGDHATSANYVGQKIRIVVGTGKGQESTISGYNGATRTATVSPAWTQAPASGSVYVIDNGPIDNSLVSATYDSTIEPAVNGAQFKVGTYHAVINSFQFSSGIKLSKLPSIASPDGFGTLRITSRAVTGTIEPELDSVANKDWIAIWKAGTEAVIDTNVIGQVAGNSYSIQLLRASVKEAPGQGARDGVRTRKLSFQADGRTADGELVIKFS